MYPSVPTLKSYGSGSAAGTTRQKVTVPVSVPQHCQRYESADGRIRIRLRILVRIQIHANDNASGSGRASRVTCNEASTVEKNLLY
jgi:hypothetical protein